MSARIQQIHSCTIRAQGVCTNDGMPLRINPFVHGRTIGVFPFVRAFVHERAEPTVEAIHAIQNFTLGARPRSTTAGADSPQSTG